MRITTQKTRPCNPNQMPTRPVKIEMWKQARIPHRIISQLKTIHKQTKPKWPKKNQSQFSQPSTRLPYCWLDPTPTRRALPSVPTAGANEILTADQSRTSSTTSWDSQPTSSRWVTTRCCCSRGSLGVAATFIFATKWSLAANATNTKFQCANSKWTSHKSKQWNVSTGTSKRDLSMPKSNSPKNKRKTTRSHSKTLSSKLW